MGDVKQKINKQQITFKTDLEPEIKNLILHMLQIDPKRRPTVAQILASPFFQSLKQSIDDQFFSSKTSTTAKHSSGRSTKKKVRRARAYRTEADSLQGSGSG